jgi:RNA polymerase sigma-70 factor (ECF subfamily)
MRGSLPSDQEPKVQLLATPQRPEDDDLLLSRILDAECTYAWTSLRRLGIAHCDCEDLMQEVFFRVHRALPSYDRSRPLRPWLFAFCARVASEHRRLARHKREVMEEADAVDARPGADDELAAAQRRRIVRVALDTLDDDKRAILVLHDFDDTPVPEIARSLGLPEGTVYSRLRAARAQFSAAVRRLVAKGGLP